MIGRVISTAVVLGLVGLVFGYLVFARQGGGYINPLELFFPGQDVFSQFGDAVRGGGGIRNNVLAAGGVGALIGAVYQFARSKR
ncbi:MAG: hypothetical protein ACLFM0_04585 [Spirochaetales bacterium]